MTVSSSAPRRTQGERSASTRARLLDATVECLTRYGYAGTTTPRIAEMAGLTRGAQVHHFGSKHELMTAAMHHMTAKTVATVVASFREGYRNAAELQQELAGIAFEQTGGPADGRGGGDGGAGYGGEEHAGEDADHGEPARQVADEGVGKVDEPRGHAAHEHEAAGEDEQGDGDEREAVDAGKHSLDDDFGRQFADGDAEQGDNAEGKAYGNAGEKYDEKQENYGGADGNHHPVLCLGHAQFLDLTGDVQDQVEYHEDGVHRDGGVEEAYGDLQVGHGLRGSPEGELDAVDDDEEQEGDENDVDDYARAGLGPLGEHVHEQVHAQVAFFFHADGGAEKDGVDEGYPDDVGAPGDVKLKTVAGDNLDEGDNEDDAHRDAGDDVDDPVQVSFCRFHIITSDRRRGGRHGPPCLSRFILCCGPFRRVRRERVS